MFTPSGCLDVGNRKIGFVLIAHLLRKRSEQHTPFERNYDISKHPLKGSFGNNNVGYIVINRIELDALQC